MIVQGAGPAARASATAMMACRSYGGWARRSAILRQAQAGAQVAQTIHSRLRSVP